MRLFGHKLGLKYGISRAEADEGDRLYAALMAAWHGDDVERVCEVLRESDKQFFYSSYPWWHRWYFEQKPQLVRYLFEHLPFERFIQFPCKRTIYPFDVISGLDALAAQIGDEQICQLAETFSFPHSNRAPQLFERIVSSPDAAMTEWLRVWIDERALLEKARGQSLSAHQKTVSAFQLRWNPLDKDLGVAVCALARRRDPQARDLTRHYLLTLPWGDDRRATEELLSGLMQREDDSVLPLLEEALAVQSRPSAGRLLLLSCLTTLVPQQALSRFLEDCGRLDDGAAIEAYLEWWHRHHEKLAPHATPTRELAGALKIEHWPMVARGRAASLWYPEWPAAPTGRGGVRAMQAITAAFDCCRVEHMGCGIVLPLCALIGLGWLSLLRHLLGPVKAGFAPIVVGCLVLWLIALALTSHTHFSGHETLAQKLGLAVAFFGSALLFLGMSLAAHW